MYLTFFVLPPRAMAWPDGAGLTVLGAPEDLVPPHILLAKEPVIGSDQQWWVQLIFHQRTTHVSQDDDAFLIVDSVMRESAGLPDPPDRAAGPRFSPDTHRETVVEVTTPLDSDDEDELGVAVNRGLDALRDADRAWLLSSGIPESPVSPADVWPIIPTLRRRREDGSLLGPPRILVLDTNELRDRPVPEEMNESARRRFEAALSAIQAHHPFVRWQEWLAAAEEARNTARPEDAVVRLGVAVEVMLDAVLAIGLWESDTSVDDGANILARELGRRLGTEFPRLFGGSWDRTRGPLAVWRNDLAHLRGRVVHRGHRPDHAEVKKAFEAADQLHRHVVDRVIARRAHFPKTAWSLLGPTGLKEQEAWDGAVRRLGEDGGLLEDDWLLRYSRWRNQVDEVIRKDAG
jgi:hypothetical protein